MKQEKNRYCVYTAITGDYDEILQPKVVDNRFDYILFSDNLSERQEGVWQIRPIPYQNCNLVKMARYVKCHPTELLPDYVSSLWIDASICLVSPEIYERYIALESSSDIMAAIKHPERNCAYEEMLAVISRGFEREKTILKWGRFLRRAHYPRNYGLTETNMLYRKHIKAIMDIDLLWWQCIERYSQRDQLSFDYCLWKTKTYYTPLLENNETAWNSNIAEYHPQHKNAKRKNVATKTKEGWIARWSSHAPGRDNRAADYYYHVCGLPCPTFAAYVMGQWLRLSDIINNFLNKRSDNA